MPLQQSNSDDIASSTLPISRDRADIVVGYGLCHGTFGELLQGVSPSNVATSNDDFLVTLPVSHRSHAVFRPDPDVRDISVLPAGKTKSALFANKLVAELGVCGGYLVIQSDILEGKGCASSSADMTAAARAIGRAFDVAISSDLIERLTLEIEPSDGVMYDECVVFRHRSTGLVRKLGHLPRMFIAAIDELGVVSTVEFDGRRGTCSAEEREEYQHLLELLSVAVPAGDLAEIGRVSTRSAEMNQRRLPKRFLPEMLEINRSIGTHGLVAAHSGTWLGLILDPADRSFSSKLSVAQERMGRLDGYVQVFENTTMVHR